MRSFSLALSLIALPLAFAGDAPVVQDNPTGAQYIAKLPDKTNTSVRGAVVVATSANGTGTSVQVSISGLPATGGPFMYHIHKFPISDNNCTTTGSHLDPYNATEVPACDKDSPFKCEVGDLSGKHGNMTGPSFSAEYADMFLSTQENTKAFIGNLSVVVHSSNKTRLTCANFTLQETNTTTTASPSSPTSSAGRVTAYAGVLGFGALIAAFM